MIWLIIIVYNEMEYKISTNIEVWLRKMWLHLSLQNIIETVIEIKKEV